MMAFADGWGWASWLILALIMLMFVIVVGGVGVMFWTADRADHESAAGDGNEGAPVARTAEAPPTS